MSVKRGLNQALNPLGILPVLPVHLSEHLLWPYLSVDCLPLIIGPFGCPAAPDFVHYISKQRMNSFLDTNS